MGTSYSITEHFGSNLAELLSEKIKTVFPAFDDKTFISEVTEEVIDRTYTERILIISQALRRHLPQDYPEAISILVSILGEENPNETGMFTHFYWVLPIGKFISEYGLAHFNVSIKAIEEVTKRNTGEYAIRPFARKYPEETLKVCKSWATAPSFHLRRLASEGLRPKLPWAPKLGTFIDNPDPVLEILELLKEDEVMFVKRSVANHLTDWLKVNPSAVRSLIERWKTSSNKHTQWIIKRATRKIS